MIYRLEDMAPGVDDARVVALHRQINDVVAEDDDLLEIITDKAAITIPSPAYGRLTAWHIAPEDMLTPHTPIVTLVDA